MSLRSFEPPKRTVYDGTDLKIPTTRTIGEEQLVPQMVKKARNAVKVDTHQFYFFQRKQSGRRCSCWTMEDSASADCKVCFGTGTVGGFDKWGTETHVIDWTHPRLNMVGVVPNFMEFKDTRPVFLVLAEGVTEGYIQTTLDIGPNRQIVDLLQLMTSNMCRENSVKMFIRAVHRDGATWADLTKPNLVARLEYKHIDIKIEFKRLYPTAPSPVFSHLLFRYNLRDDLVLKMDIPRVSDSISLSDYGLYDVFSSITMFSDDTLKTVSSMDFFHDIQTGVKWKVTEVQPFKPLGILTNYDITCRVVQEFEQMHYVD